MIGSVSQNENAPKITLSDFTEPEELLDKELDTRIVGMYVSVLPGCILFLQTDGQPSHSA